MPRDEHVRRLQLRRLRLINYASRVGKEPLQDGTSKPGPRLRRQFFALRLGARALGPCECVAHAITSECDEELGLSRLEA